MSAIRHRYVRRPRPAVHLALCTALLTAATSVCAAAEPVGTDESSATKTLGEITVTAEKRAENVQKVPESITTLDT